MTLGDEKYPCGSVVATRAFFYYNLLCDLYKIQKLTENQSVVLEVTLVVMFKG